MPAIIPAILAFIQALPELLKIARELLAYAGQAADYFERLQKLKQIKEGIKDARETKDTTKLEDSFGIGKTIHKEETHQIQMSPVVSLKFTSTTVEEKKSPEPVLELPEGINAKLFTKPEIFASPTHVSKAFQEMDVTSSPEQFAGLMGFGTNGGVGDVKGNSIIYSNLGPSSQMGSRLIGLALLILFGSGCRTVPNQPNYKPELFAGDSKLSAVVRRQSNEVVTCESPEFDNYVALTYDSMACLVTTYINNCVAYKTANPPCQRLSPAQIDKIKEIVRQR